MTERDPFKTVINESGEIVKGGCVVVGEDGRYLLVRYPGGDIWSLPKGHTEPGESIEESAKREAEEETGYEVQIVRDLPEFTYLDGNTGWPIRLHLWLARAVGDGGGAADEEFGWFSYDEMLERVFPNTAAYLEENKSRLVIK